jgi:hydrogenase expression/formation protein HypD
MKLEAFRDAENTKRILKNLQKATTRPWVIMEICGGQTHAIFQSGLDQLLPSGIELVHGPGCPVCVTALETLDKALAIASLPNVIFCSFGDMLRVPGSGRDLFSVRAAGGQIRILYSPMDAIEIAKKNPEKEVVFFGIGFETTAPVNAAAILLADKQRIRNFSMLVAQVCVPPAMQAILSAPDNRVQGFLAAGHVCAVMGYWEYLSIAEKYRVPIVVTGFEPLDLAHGLYCVVQLLEAGKFEVANAYPRVVTKEGNRSAQAMIREVFEPCDRNWRGIGCLPMSGLGLRSNYSEFDAEKRFAIEEIRTQESQDCIAGQILKGQKKPFECAAFRVKCTPENPLGAPMVSSEGVCNAYFRYTHPRTSS